MLEQREQQKVLKTNTQKVAHTVQEKFGDKAEEVFYSKATELGMTNEQFNNLAAQSPDAVLAFFNTAPITPTPVNSSTINTTALSPQQAEYSTVMENGVERIKLKPAESSVLMGSTHQKLMEEAHRHKAAVFAKYGIKS